MNLECGRFSLSLSRPLVMGIVNVTPDSFSDGGQYATFETALAQASALIADGADILDIGGESTRPGAAPVALVDELTRVIPLVKALANCGIPISVDTQKPEVMQAAIDAGASMINDVNALRAPGALEACAAASVAVCIMHMQGVPATMQVAPRYDAVLSDVHSFLQARAVACVQAGITKNRIVWDPGFGFGKTVEHNFALLRDLSQLAQSGYPILAGLSRKSSIGAVTGRDVGERLAGSLAAALIAAQNGATILRVHDVRETADALKVLSAVKK